jgi:hypothetical protein
MLLASRVTEIVRACLPDQIPDEIRDTLYACLERDDLDLAGARAIAPHLHFGEGIQVRVMAFEIEKLEQHRTEVEAMLHELRPSFWTEDGDSFLNACVNKDGRHWGEHPNIEELMLLGTALGLVQCMAPRVLWFLLPGAMPYYKFVPSKWVCADCVRAVAEVTSCPHCLGSRIVLRSMVEDALGHTIEVEAAAQAATSGDA